jgi:hypothetical protein
VRVEFALKFEIVRIQAFRYTLGNEGMYGILSTVTRFDHISERTKEERLWK